VELFDTQLLLFNRLDQFRKHNAMCFAIDMRCVICTDPGISAVSPHVTCHRIFFSNLQRVVFLECTWSFQRFVSVGIC